MKQEAFIEVIIKIGNKKCVYRLENDVEYLERITIYDLILRCEN